MPGEVRGTPQQQQQLQQQQQPKPKTTTATKTTTTAGPDLDELWRVQLAKQTEALSVSAPQPPQAADGAGGSGGSSRRANGLVPRSATSRDIQQALQRVRRVASLLPAGAFPLSAAFRGRAAGEGAAQRPRL